MGRAFRLLLGLAPAVLCAAAASAGPPVELWNGRDLSGWTIFSADPAADAGPVWRALDGGVLRLESKASGYLRTTATFSHYRLHLEWRWPAEAPAKPNSGVILHVNGPDRIWPDGYEFQLRAGIAGQIVAFRQELPGAPVSNGLQRAARLAPPSERPPGEWNVAEITCRGDTLEIVVNGVRQNLVTGLPVARGGLALQLEGAPVEFRHLRLVPLE